MSSRWRRLTQRRPPPAGDCLPASPPAGNVMDVRTPGAAACFPHSPDGGVSEDATPQFHLCVGVPVHGRDHGSALPQLHVPLSRRPDLAGAHAPLHARAVRARAADPHLHPPGPQQRQTAHPAAAHPAARTRRQVSGGPGEGGARLSLCHGWKRWTPSRSRSPPSNVSYPPQVSSPVMVFLVKNMSGPPSHKLLTAGLMDALRTCCCFHFLRPFVSDWLLTSCCNMHECLRHSAQADRCLSICPTYNTQLPARLCASSKISRFDHLQPLDPTGH